MEALYTFSVSSNVYTIGCPCIYKELCWILLKINFNGVKMRVYKLGILGTLNLYFNLKPSWHIGHIQMLFKKWILRLHITFVYCTIGLYYLRCCYFGNNWFSYTNKIISWVSLYRLSKCIWLCKSSKVFIITVFRHQFNYYV